MSPHNEQVKGEKGKNTSAYFFLEKKAWVEVGVGGGIAESVNPFSLSGMAQTLAHYTNTCREEERDRPGEKERTRKKDIRQVYLGILNRPEFAPS